MRAFALALILALPMVAFGSELQVSPKHVFFVPGIGKTCAGSEVQPNRLRFHRVSVNWTEDAKLTVVMMRLKLASPHLANGSYTCTVSGADLDHALNTVKGEIEPNTKTSGICGIHCGSISFVSESVAPFTAEGVIEIAGVAQEKDGSERPVRLSAPIAAEYY